jgi:hypothetical protein
MTKTEDRFIMGVDNVCLFVCYYASRRDVMYLRIIQAQYYKFQ